MSEMQGDLIGVDASCPLVLKELPACYCKSANDPKRTSLDKSSIQAKIGIVIKKKAITCRIGINPTKFIEPKIIKVNMYNYTVC